MKRRPKPAITLIEASSDPKLFAGWFRQRKTWAAWFAFLKVLFGLSLNGAELEIFRQCTGRSELPAGMVREGYLICGRRAGKSFILALVAVFLALFVDWTGCLSPGERGTIVIIAADRKQARTIFRYIVALLKVRLLAAYVERHTSDAIDLNNHLTIEIQTASFRTTRGYTLVAALLDELAFWRSEDSSNPDTEIMAAIRPAMATVPGSMLLCASSPYARRGALYDAYRKHYGKDGPVLVWKAPTKTMNPTVPESVIAEAYEADPANAAAEYGAEFRTDVETFVSREVVEAAVVPGRHELPPTPRGGYVAFVDPSGGSADSMTLAITRRDQDGGRAVVVALRERRPPFSPDDVVIEFSALCKMYGISVVYGDRYAGEWPRERFQVHGIRYEVAEKPKSDLYRDLLPLLNSGRVELLDNSRLVAQLCQLERRTARGGRDSIDHAPGGHDDIANAVAGALVALAGDTSGWLKFCGQAATALHQHPPHPRYGRHMPTSSMRHGARFDGEPGSAQELAFYRRLRRAGRM